MKRICPVIVAAAMLLATAGVVCAQDSGIRDTMYLEIYTPDLIPSGDPPYFVRFPLYVTHDIIDPVVDSLAGFVIPLCFRQSNPVSYCSLSYWWNTTSMIAEHPSVLENRSILRHLPSVQDPQIRNRMLDMNANYINGWDFIFLDLSNQISKFGLSMVPTGSKDQRWWEGSRILLATMTFRLEDSTTICIDTCMWPPGGDLRWANSDAETYIPVHFLEICETIVPTDPPPWVHCPQDQSAGTDGQHTAIGFSVESQARTIQSVNATASGVDLGAAWVQNLTGLGTSHVQGDVVYEVTNHCGTSGMVTVSATDDGGRTGKCSFSVSLWNDSPSFALGPSRRALAGYLMNLRVLAVDVNQDEAGTFWNGIRHETDPGRNPVHQPSYQTGNPGWLAWEVTESDTGSWICSFSATDDCDAADTQEINILVGVPYCGDLTGEGELDVADIIFLLNYLFKGGDPPVPLCRGDANCNGERDAGDVVLLINFLFKNSFAPCFECCAE